MPKIHEFPDRYMSKNTLKGAHTSFPGEPKKSRTLSLCPRSGMLTHHLLFRFLIVNLCKTKSVDIDELLLSFEQCLSKLQLLFQDNLIFVNGKRNGKFIFFKFTSCSNFFRSPFNDIMFLKYFCIFILFSFDSFNFFFFKQNVIHAIFSTHLLTV